MDNEVLIDAAKHYVKIGDFADILITEATDFDLYGEPVSSERGTVNGEQWKFDSLPLAQYHIEWLLPAFAAFGVGAIINNK